MSTEQHVTHTQKSEAIVPKRNKTGMSLLTFPSGTAETSNNRVELFEDVGWGMDATATAGPKTPLPRMCIHLHLP
jgi:hypothetical protein